MKAQVASLIFIAAAVFVFPAAGRAAAPEFAPCCLSAAQVNSSQIMIAWTPIGSPDPGLNGWRIERATGVDGGFTVIVVNTGTGANTYTDSNLAPNTTYSYRVSGVNADGVSPPSIPASATTAAGGSYAVPDKPQNLAVTPVSASALEVKWSAPAGGAAVTGYTIERSPGGGGDYAIIVTNTSATSYTDGPLAPGSTYGYRVYALNSYGPGLPTAAVVATAPTRPSEPRAVNAIAGNGAATLNWAPPGFTGGSITGYLITNTTTGATTTVGNITSTTVAGLTNGTAYSFSVAAMNLAGNGPASVAVRVIPGVPVAAPTPVPTPAPESPAAPTSPATPQAAARYRFTFYLQVGSRGIAVTELQNRLTAEGVYTGPITGYFGLLTRAGVMAYQAANSIDAAGVVGPLTRARLNAGL